MTEPTWLLHARTFLGLGEVKGPKHNATIVRWWEAIKATFRDDETPWCAAFVGGVLEDIGIESSRNASARSYLKWGYPLTAPAVGCVVVFSRPGSAWSGHVGFVVGEDAKGRLLVLGGNQGDQVSVAPFDRARVLGYRWPLGTLQYAQRGLPLLASTGTASVNEA